MLQLVWLIWKRVKTGKAVCAGRVSGLQSNNCTCFSHPRSDSCFWRFEKKCHNYLLCLPAILTTLKNKEKKIREGDLILLDSCSCWEQWCFRALSWASLVVKYAAGGRNWGDTESSILYRTLCSQTDISLAQAPLIFNRVKRGYFTSFWKRKQASFLTLARTSHIKRKHEDIGLRSCQKNLFTFHYTFSPVSNWKQVQEHLCPCHAVMLSKGILLPPALQRNTSGP